MQVLDGWRAPMVPVPPERTVAQRMSALDRANEIRTRRADIKRGLKAGRLEIGRLLLDADGPDYREWLETARVLDLLLAAPKIGRVKANKMLNRARISPSKTIGGMTVRQRRELVALLWGGR